MDEVRPGAGASGQSWSASRDPQHPPGGAEAPPRPLGKGVDGRTGGRAPHCRSVTPGDGWFTFPIILTGFLTGFPCIDGIAQDAAKETRNGHERPTAADERRGAAGPIPGLLTVAGT
ncbi:hypothetical protein GCM10023082_33010 [Streptomyces tremellae]|uniref:Uncharacterized protein n=1 Tax=Streptomyces tremellae TaxID=1124239 RepID=A0ABP7FAE5_9ACTN